MATGVLHFATSRPATSVMMASTSRESTRAASTPAFPPARAAAAARSRAAVKACAMSIGHFRICTLPEVTVSGPSIDVRLTARAARLWPMAEIELAPLSHRLDEDEVKTLAGS